ncbi:MAG: glycosyltransferase family 39 protein [Pseudonocardia sp.]|uniref:glycosyltransferase family 39 protein n=1 Tax=Pseudonocardia sp. TaxID=60912 RepID=UPI001ACA3740|nr:glycosyltransferase family 39 protein [Pseudonocardia sp.]MBN9099299.1 glycosyltransferase family 39 protein [Pseudonocardia sp.]
MTLRRGWPLAAVAVLAALAYGRAMVREPLGPYDAAAVRRMAGSWHDVVFGAFDPAGTVSLDKLPGAFWLQALSARLLGVHTWALVLPQVAEGVLTVLVLHRVVRRCAGRPAGLAAAAVLAASPAVVALNRGSISGSLMILLVVLAADAVVGALQDGRAWRLALAGVWIGLAFQATMIEAWLVLSALAVAVLVAAPGPLRRRIGGVAVGGVTTAVVSLLWMGAVRLVPVDARPYADGSVTNSVFEQVLGYNGLARVGAQSPLQVLPGQGLDVAAGAPPGWDRLLTGDLGRDTGWLLPVALVAAVALLLSRRGEPRTDPVRAAVLLWGVWAVTLGVASSWAATINGSYTAALAPAVAALCGIGAATAWAHRAEAPTRVAVVVAVLGAAVYGAALLWESTAPAWLLPTLVAVSLAALVLVAVRVERVGLGVAALAVLLVPATASVSLVLHGYGAFDTPFESSTAARGIHRLFVATPARAARPLPALGKARAGAPDLPAGPSSAVTSVVSYPTAQEVLPIGGSTGTQPVRRSTGGAPTSPAVRSTWYSRSRATTPAGLDRDAPPGGRRATPPLRSYYCLPADATG